MPEDTMNRGNMAKTMNEWMRRYIDEPEKFEQEFRTVIAFIGEDEEGKVPSYGEKCAAYLFELLAELEPATTPTLAP